jgi:anti-sigma factor RsiW
MNTPHDLTCQELVELVTAYLEGTLSAAERLRFVEHLAECEGCTTYLDHMWQIVRLLGCLSEDDLSPQAQQNLLETFRDWKKKR